MLALFAPLRVYLREAEQCRSAVFILTFNFAIKVGEFELRDERVTAEGHKCSAAACTFDQRPVEATPAVSRESPTGCLVCIDIALCPSFFFNVHKYFVSSGGTSVIAYQEWSTCRR